MANKERNKIHKKEIKEEYASFITLISSEFDN